MVHTMNVNAPATTASTTPACAERADMALSICAPLASFPDRAGSLGEADEPDELEEVEAPDGTAY